MRGWMMGAAWASAFYKVSFENILIITEFSNSSLGVQMLIKKEMYKKKDTEKALGELEENLEEERMICSVNEAKMLLKMNCLP